MQALIDFLIKNFLKVWPLTRVLEWKQGMIIRNGAITRTLVGGRLHWRWPFVEEAFQWPTNIVALDLGTASVTTCDGQPVALSANLQYQMHDIAAFYRALWNTENTLKHVALGEIATYAAGQPWPMLATKRRDVEAQIMAQLNERATDWGLRVVAVHLTDLVPTKSHRHYVDGITAKV